MHFPVTHIWLAAQRVVQSPQWVRSVWVSAQVIVLGRTPAHIMAPVLHVHVPAAQVPSPQAWPHVPQLLRSPVGSTQLPLQSSGAAVGQPDAHE